MSRVGVSQAARLAGKSEQTIRNWEARGWITALGDNAWGYREYDADEVCACAAWRAEVTKEIALLRIPPHVKRAEREAKQDLYTRVAV
jgi:hypothetical protein